jgi:glycosyltransferase involved in cell wall biosynthesis
VLLVCREKTLWGHDAAIRRALARHLSVEEYIVDERWPDSAAMLGGLRAFDAVIWFVKFRVLRSKAAFDWAGYEGLRLMYDWDACQDFSPIHSRNYLGQYGEVFRRHRFDVLVCTGRRTRDHFREQGLDAEWIPKAADHETFEDLGLDRAGLCTYGASYPARQVMLRHLRGAGVLVEGLFAPPVDLNVALNRHLGCVICNAELRMPLLLAKVLAPASRGRIPVLAEGPEPMIKNFEVAASGTAPICDELGELAELGFIDGRTAVLYRSLPELTEKVRGLLADPDALRTIGHNAAELVRTRHTWEARGAEFTSLIRSRLSG